MTPEGVFFTALTALIVLFALVATVRTIRRRPIMVWDAGECRWRPARAMIPRQHRQIAS